MTPQEQEREQAERRELIRKLIQNTRTIYTAIESAAEGLADAIRKAAPSLKTDQPGPESALIVTVQDWDAAISAVMDETRELMEWELLNQANPNGKGMQGPQRK